MSRVRRGTFNPGKEILRHSDFTAIPVMLDGSMAVDNKSVVNIDDRKVVKAGAILGGKTGKILEGGTVAVVKGDGAEGVLRYDVDITDGSKEVSMVIRGDVYEDKLPDTLTEEVRNALKTRILFIK